MNILQVYKSSGSVERARKFYEDYSKVPSEYLKYRKIILSKQKPYTLRMYSNLELVTHNENENSLAQRIKSKKQLKTRIIKKKKEDEQVEIIEYEESI